MIRKVTKKVFSMMFRIMPFPVVKYTVTKIPILASCLPLNKDIVFYQYLGNLKVDINTLYPIEQKMLTGLYDPDTVSIVRKFVRESDICLDIGANVGAITLALAQKTGVSGKVYSFEPGGMTYGRLSRNLELNPNYLSVVQPIKKGLSDQEDTLYWVEDQNNRGNAGFINKNTINKNGEPVEFTTIDNFVKNNAVDRIDFVKIDVEGMELEVLLGGKETWAKIQPIFYYETIKRFENMRKRKLFLEIEEFLKGYGYEFYKVLPGGEIEETSYPDLTENTLAIPLSRQ